MKIIKSNNKKINKLLLETIAGEMINLEFNRKYFVDGKVQEGITEHYPSIEIKSNNIIKCKYDLTAFEGIVFVKSDYVKIIKTLIPKILSIKIEELQKVYNIQELDKILLHKYCTGLNANTYSAINIDDSNTKNTFSRLLLYFDEAGSLYSKDSFCWKFKYLESFDFNIVLSKSYQTAFYDYCYSLLIDIDDVVNINHNNLVYEFIPSNMRNYSQVEIKKQIIDKNNIMNNNNNNNIDTIDDDDDENPGKKYYKDPNKLHYDIQNTIIILSKHYNPLYVKMHNLFYNMSINEKLRNNTYRHTYQIHNIDDRTYFKFPLDHILLKPKKIMIKDKNGINIEMYRDDICTMCSTELYEKNFVLYIPIEHDNYTEYGFGVCPQCMYGKWHNLRLKFRYLFIVDFPRSIEHMILTSDLTSTEKKIYLMLLKNNITGEFIEKTINEHQFCKIENYVFKSMTDMEYLTKYCGSIDNNNNDHNKNNDHNNINVLSFSNYDHINFKN